MLKSHDDMRKYKDAIMWGAKVAGQQLPTSFYTKMNKFLQAYKNEVAQGKKRGMVEDVSSDPINTTLYGLLMLWAIESNNVFSGILLADPPPSTHLVFTISPSDWTA
jgi:hypothetical protein